MKNTELEKEIKKVNARIDMLMSEIERQNEAKTCACTDNYPRRDEILFKTYETIRRMKFDNDMQISEKRIKELDEQIANLEKEKQYRIADRQDIERRFYSEG